MELKQLQSFVAVVKYGSFTKAAEKLYLSQPTVSAHVQALEEELHRRLIIRTTKSLEITPKGQEVYDCAVRMLELQHRMIRTCAEDSQRIIHLGASTIPSAYILPQLLPEFGRQHPDIYFIVHQSNSQGVIDGLTDGIFDIGLIGMRDEEKLTCVPFCEDRIVLITPVEPAFLEMQRRPELPLDELLAQPIILREKSSGSQKAADRLLDSLGIAEEQLHIVARVNDQETIKNLVAGGFGISFLSARAAQNLVEEKRLLLFELPGHNTRHLYLAYRKDYILQSHIREFYNFVRRKFSN